MQRSALSLGSAKQRYLLLTDDAIEWFDDETQLGAPKGRLPLDGSRVERTQPSAAPPSPRARRSSIASGQESLIIVSASGEQLILRGDDLDGWEASISEAIQMVGGGQRGRIEQLERQLAECRAQLAAAGVVALDEVKPQVEGGAQNEGGVGAADDAAAVGDAQRSNVAEITLPPLSSAKARQRRKSHTTAGPNRRIKLTAHCTGGRCVEVQVWLDDTIRKLRAAVQLSTGFHANNQRVIYGGEQPSSSATLRSLGLDDTMDFFVFV